MYVRMQIWALAVSPETDKLATGGGDSLVNLWTDCTVDDEEEAIRQEVRTGASRNPVTDDVSSAQLLEPVSHRFQVRLSHFSVFRRSIFVYLLSLGWVLCNIGV